MNFILKIYMVRNNRTRLKLIFLILVIFMGIIGSIFFFPMNIDGAHTCLYHKLKHENDNCRCVHVINHCLTNQSVSRFDAQNQQACHAELLNRYVIPFGCAWWGSLLLTVAGIISVRKIIREKRGK